MLTKKLDKHRFTGRIENFSVADKDSISFDDNNEDGNALTLNFSYHLSKTWFLHSEFTRINSERPARVRRGHPEKMIEKQLIFGARYFFK